MTKEERKEYNRLYRLKNREQIYANKKYWIKQNLEKYKEQKREYNRRWRAKQKQQQNN